VAGSRSSNTGSPASEPVIFFGAGASSASAPSWSDALSAALERDSDARTEISAEDFAEVLEWLGRPAIASPDGPAPGDELEALGRLRRLKEATSVLMSYFVAHARASNRTWAEIGEALGTTAQNAQRNYRRLMLTTNYDGLLEAALRRSQSGEIQPEQLAQVSLLHERQLQPLLQAHQGGAQDRPWAIAVAGPPGSGKTAFAHALARALDWPVTVVTPADLLTRGTDALPTQLASLLGRLDPRQPTVVLLDDMEALLSDRTTSGVQARLVTTALMGGLSRLRERGNALVVLTLREGANIDPALLRRGRIDALISLQTSATAGRNNEG
jgi:hypothetical protein